MVASETMETVLKVLVMESSLRPPKWPGGEPLQQRKTSHHSRCVVGLLDRVWYILYWCVRIEGQSQTFLLRHVRRVLELHKHFPSLTSGTYGNEQELTDFIYLEP